MIRYEDISIYDVIDAMEALAYKVLHYQYPTWHSIPEEEVVLKISDIIDDKGNIK